MKGLLVPQGDLIIEETFGLADHFVNKDTTKWTTTATDSGSASMSDAAGGVIVLSASDGTVADNDETYLLSTSEIFKIAAGKPIAFRSLARFSQANTNAANVFAGLVDAIAANTLVDNGAGMKTSFSGAVFLAVDGKTNWHVVYSDGSTQTVVELTAANALNKTAQVAASSTNTLLEIDIVPKTSTLVDVIFKINGSTVYKMLDKTYASATEMGVGFGVKNGSGTMETLYVDAVAVSQKL